MPAGYANFVLPANPITLHDENGWSYERAEHWLCRKASQALLRDYTPP
jgi:hypothetical protein